MTAVLATDMLAVEGVTRTFGSGRTATHALRGVSFTVASGQLVALLAVTYLGPPPSFALKGDVILANDWISMTYLIGGMALVTTAVYRSWLAVLDEKLAARRR